MHLPLIRLLSELHVRHKPAESQVAQSIGHVITQMLFYKVYPLLHIQTDPCSAAVITNGSVQEVQYDMLLQEVHVG